MRLTPRRPTLTMLLLVLLAFFCLDPTRGSAQATSSGTIVGVVTDGTGALVPGATITLTDLATKVQRTTVTNKDGSYVMVDVVPAVYNIAAAKAGFSQDLIAGQTVEVGSQTTANFAMAVGSESTTIEVQATSVDLQTLNASLGSTVTPTEINSLPSINRDVSTFSTLQPGVTPGGSVAGTVQDQAVFQLDGGNNSSDMDGSMKSYTGAFGGSTAGTISSSGASGVMPMPQDSVEEFKVATVGQTADFNNSSGSQVQVVTKRGTNRFHGTVYEYYLDNNFNGNTWQNRLVGQAKPSFHYSRFGAAAGGPIAPYFLGGKTYLFGNYEGYRFPNSATYERSVPSAALRAGGITLGATTFSPAQLAAADPRGIGANPAVLAFWNKYEPLPNDLTCALLGSGARCDGVNSQGFRANVALPQKQNFFVFRADHDFGSKWHFNSSYRYFKLSQLTMDQVDIGGVYPGDTLGKPTAVENRPQTPWYFVSGLTTNISSTFTNDFHYSYLRNYWSWNNNGAAPLAGFGGALEPFGEYSTTSLTPVNINTQNTRTRIWDGHDHFLRDDLTKLKGNHLVQFGGQYQHNFAFHNRTDNGSGIDYYTTYQLGDSTGAGLVQLTGLAANGIPATASTTNGRIVAAALGIVTDSQVAYTRTGNNLTLNAPLTPAADYSTIPFYNLYVSDTWKLRHSLTINYGLGWALEMPPHEATGKQVSLVDASDEPIKTFDYLKQRQNAAANGTVYNPQVGFALVGNVGSGLKYPFNPFYAGFSPRISAAYNPNVGDGFLGKILGGNATVIRGGYGRVYGRLNGVGLVLTPLLGPGLIQAVNCRTALSNGTCGSASPTDSNAFRIGVDGNVAPLQAATPTLPQPFYPGYNGSASTAASVLDPNFRPNDVDTFNLTIQRQVSRKMLVEVGYIGRLIHHEFEPVNINTVPYMMSQGGQSFSSAYAAVETAFGCATSQSLCAATTTNATKNKIYPIVSAQPFFETALAGTGYCTGYSNCTSAVVAKQASQFGNQQVFNLWTNLDNGGFNFPRSLMGTAIPGQPTGANGQVTSGVQLSTATGYGNYHGGFISFKITDFHGLTLNENFTYSKALGLNATAQSSSGGTPNDAFDLRKSYGVQAFNQKFIFNTFLVYQAPFYKSQQGFVGHLAGGWTIAPIFTAGSGLPIPCTTNSISQSFGAADASGFNDNENCVFTSVPSGAHRAFRNVAGGVDPNNAAIKVGTTTAGTGNAAINLFQNPTAVWDGVRAPILGIDEHNGGDGPIYGLPYFNLDTSITKRVRVSERFNLELSGVFINVFNHVDFKDPTLSLSTPASFGVITAQGNQTRQIQAGARVNF